MEPTNGRYEAGFTAAELNNLKIDVAEIKENVKILVEKHSRLEIRVYAFAAAIAAVTAKGATVLGYLLGGH